MKDRKVLVICIVVLCFALAGASYVLLSPRDPASSTESQSLSDRSAEMARRAAESAPPPRQPLPEPPPLTTKGPINAGG